MTQIVFPLPLGWRRHPHLQKLLPVLLRKLVDWTDAYGPDSDTAGLVDVLADDVQARDVVIDPRSVSTTAGIRSEGRHLVVDLVSVVSCQGFAPAITEILGHCDVPGVDVTADAAAGTLVFRTTCQVTGLANAANLLAKAIRDAIATAGSINACLVGYRQNVLEAGIGIVHGLADLRQRCDQTAASVGRKVADIA